MTDEEVGCYMRMLCVQWNRGGVDRSKVCRMSDPGVVESVICEKFSEGADGLFRNARLEEVRSVQQSRSRAGSKGGAKSQAKRKQTPSKPQANDEAKSKPPSPSPSPSPDDSHTHTQREQILNHSAVADEWREDWGRWLDSWESRMDKPLDPVVAEVHLMDLSAKEPAKAAADLRFSLGKSARSILDSDNDFSVNRKGTSRKPPEKF